MIQNILIICIGNICRSPMGEILLASLLKDKYQNVSVSSAGLSALVGHPADPMVQDLIHKRGLDISKHSARQASLDILQKADLILTMDNAQQKAIEQQNPGLRGRVHRVGQWSGYDVPDPYRRPKVIFEQALTLIDQGINEWYRKLWN